MRWASTSCLSLILLAAFDGPRTEAATNEPPRLETVRREYEGKLLEIQQERDNRAKAQGDWYQRGLDGIETSLKNEGDLEGLLALRAERERFKREESFSSNTLAQTPVELVDLQGQCQTALARYEDEKNEQVVKLAQGYMTTLAALMKDLTQQGRIDEALSVRQERDGVHLSAAVASAEAALAESAAQRGQPRPDSTATPTTAAGNAQEAERWDATGGPDVAIYDESPLPAAAEKHAVRRLDATPTDRGRLLQKISAKLILGKRKIGNENRQFLRAHLGSSSANKEIEKPTLVVDYYAKSSGTQGQGSAKDTTKVRTELIRLPNLTGDRKIVVDTAGIAGSLNLFGMIVSVYDGRGDLACQLTTRPSLKDLAPAQMPAAP